jgi:hypothetical protein
MIGVPATRPDAALIDFAVRVARSAVARDLGDSHIRNTLGVALYRARDWSGAAKELEESIRLDPQATHFGHDGFVLAMARWQLGQKAEALDLFGRAAAWMEDKNAPRDPELLHFRAEAENLLRPALLDAAFPADPFASSNPADLGKDALLRGVAPR